MASGLLLASGQLMHGQVPLGEAVAFWILGPVSLAGAIGMLANFLFFFGGGRSDERNNPLGLVGGLLIMLLAPLAATLVQLAISRTREYAADQGGALIGRVQAEDDPHRGGLAGPVRADEAGDLAGLDGERHAVQRNCRPEPLAQPVHFDRDLHLSLLRIRCGSLPGPVLRS